MSLYVWYIINRREKQQKTVREIMDKKCVLVCAGQLHKEDSLLIEQYVRAGAYLVAVDGGFDYCHQMGLKPELCLGDFDSVSEGQKAGLWKEADSVRGAGRFCEIIKLPVEKDDTDTLAALKLCLERGYREFYIFGGCGGRLDHTIANIQCLLFLKREGSIGSMITGEESIFVLKDEAVCFSAETQGVLSLFALSGEAKGVSISGMKYNLEDAIITNDFPIGISNEFVGKESSVVVREGELLVVVNKKSG